MLLISVAACNLLCLRDVNMLQLGTLFSYLPTLSCSLIAVIFPLIGIRVFTPTVRRRNMSYRRSDLHTLGRTK